MADATELLLVRRALGRALPEEYLEWAAEQLSRDRDGANLRILAGLSARFDRDEIEAYFQRASIELGLTGLTAGTSALETAHMIQRAYAGARLSAEESVEMMADVYQTWDHAEELLRPWYGMREALETRDDYSYPLSALDSVDEAVRREWSLLERATKLRLQPGWLDWSRCDDCAHTGPIRVVVPSFLARLLGSVTGRETPCRAACGRCGSERLESLQDPRARSAYFDDLDRPSPPTEPAAIWR